MGRCVKSYPDVEIRIRDGKGSAEMVRLEIFEDQGVFFPQITVVEEPGGYFMEAHQHQDIACAEQEALNLVGRWIIVLQGSADEAGFPGSAPEPCPQCSPKERHD